LSTKPPLKPYAINDNKASISSPGSGIASKQSTNTFTSPPTISIQKEYEELDQLLTKGCPVNIALLEIKIRRLQKAIERNNFDDVENDSKVVAYMER